jgi:hypothetical protein
MKNSLKLLSIIAAAALTAGGAHAESQYGYDATGAGVRSASAQLNVTVNIPKLILLRVGTSGATVDTATLNASIATGIPGGVANPLANGSNSTGWDGTAPVWNAADSGTVQAWAWTNSSGGGRVTASGTGGISTITVGNSAPINGGLAHPGATLSGVGQTDFSPNTVVSSLWTYSMTAAALAAAPAGVQTRLMTYTATSL